MSARNHEQWTAPPNLQSGEWVDSKIYSDEAIFEEELEKIWKQTWIPVCHEGPCIPECLPSSWKHD
jgi:methanesulfonate monooxygenase large subunit